MKYRLEYRLEHNANAYFADVYGITFLEAVCGLWVQLHADPSIGSARISVVVTGEHFEELLDRLSARGSNWLPSG